MTPYIFIVGAQRSGTTWLQRLLAAHPLIAGGQESHMFSGYLAPWWQRWQEEQAYRDNGGRTIGLGCYLDENDFLDEMRGLVQRILGRVQQAKPGATLIVEKTPDHALHLPLIHRLFPDAIILHLLRDGRDVVASMLHAKLTDWGRDWAPKSAAEATQRWVNHVRTVQQDLPLFARSRTLRYENLQTRPVETLSELFNYLGIPLSLNEVEAIVRQDESVDSLIVREAVRGDAPEPAGFRRQEQRPLAQGSQAVIVQEAGELLRELGYDTSIPDPQEKPQAEFHSTSRKDDLPWKMPRSLAIIDVTNAQMLFRERLLLYSTVLALAPERCLEIGVCQGGSSRIIHAALRDLGRGRLISIDPELQLPSELPQQLADYVTFHQARSPQGLDEAKELAGGDFDFVLIDGDHSEWGVQNDLIGLLEVTRPGSIILAHDAYYSGVEAGVRSVLKEHLPYVDGGMVSTTRHPGKLGDEEVAFGGFRLLIRTEDNGRRGQRGLVRRITRKLASIVRSPRSR